MTVESSKASSEIDEEFIELADDRDPTGAIQTVIARMMRKHKIAPNDWGGLSQFTIARQA